MSEIQEDFHDRIEEKMKKVHQSTEIVKLIEEKRISDFENKKFERFENKYEEKHNLKSDQNEKRFKDKRRFEDVRDNFIEIQKKFERKTKELSTKLKSKNQNRISDQNIEYFVKRQNSNERFSQNSNNLKRDRSMKSMRYLQERGERNIRSNEKIRSVGMSQENVR